MTVIRKGKTMYFVTSPEKGSLLKKGVVESKGSVNTKLIVNNDDGTKTRWQVANLFIGDTPEEAYALRNAANEKQKQTQAIRAQSNATYLPPFTMAYFNEGGKEELMQVMGNRTKAFETIDKNGVCWVIPKTNFIKEAPNAPLFRTHQELAFAPGKQVEMMTKNGKQIATIDKVNPKKLVVNIHGKSGLFEINKFACKVI